MRKKMSTFYLLCALVLVPVTLMLAFFAMPYKWEAQEFIGKSVKDLHPDAEKMDFFQAKEMFLFQSGKTLMHSGFLTIKDADTAPVVVRAYITNRFIVGDTTLLSKRRIVAEGRAETMIVIWPFLEFTIR
ncbi:hypothetical protein [Diaphorobacter caeni]|uniref:hypothetical protein n=1 Tax=Diaphorobacter caeni TaxID=2784387 RepID=UPI00188EA093|nr:hypothetical protein [Diaphorobacter caeni]MBF5004519.1 hypothetical protein [Diaphorobacter caeni]